MKQYIFFDHDGVLVDTEKYYFEATRRSLLTLDVVIDRALYLDYLANGGSVWQLARDKGFNDADIRQVKERRNALYRTLITTEDIEIPGVLPALQALAADFRLCIVTTSRKADFEAIHRTRNMLQYFDFVLALGDYERPKPFPDPYLAALARYNCSPAEAVVVEDSVKGLKAALAANIDCVVVRNPFTAAQEFSGARKLIDSLRELVEWLKVSS